jgi:hypothetical protein
MAMLDSVRRGVRVPVRWLLVLGIAATLAVNVTHDLRHGPVDAAVGAWQTVALVSLYELLMVIIRGAQVPAHSAGGAGMPQVDPLHEQAVRVFTDDLATACVPWVHVIHARPHVGQPRAHPPKNRTAVKGLMR